jgi:tRNA pseudouridine55 synthase
MRVDCSKGTYIRTLCHDIGGKLGCGGCMEKLFRTRVDRFEIEDSLRLGEVEKLVEEGRLAEKIIPHCRRKIIRDDDLVLKGLEIIYRKNCR